jgi:hypothetical protein
MLTMDQTTAMHPRRRAHVEGKEGGARAWRTAVLALVLLSGCSAAAHASLSQFTCDCLFPDGGLSGTSGYFSQSKNCITHEQAQAFCDSVSAQFISDAATGYAGAASTCHCIIIDDSDCGESE